MRLFTLVSLLTFSQAGLSHPATHSPELTSHTCHASGKKSPTNDMQYEHCGTQDHGIDPQPVEDTPAVLRYFRVFHNISARTRVPAGENLYKEESDVAILTGLGFVGPRTDVNDELALDIPNEPTGNYDTLLRREVLPYGASNPWHDIPFYAQFMRYDAALCGRMCTSLTNDARPTHPFINGAVAVCNMFVAYELQTITPPSKYEGVGYPVSMVCELYSSVWSSHYQSVREIPGFVFGQAVMLRPRKISIYDRDNYPYPHICAMRETCGKDYYAGGDCSGWGEGHC